MVTAAAPISIQIPRGLFFLFFVSLISKRNICSEHKSKSANRRDNVVAFKMTHQQPMFSALCLLSNSSQLGHNSTTSKETSDSINLKYSQI